MKSVKFSLIALLLFSNICLNAQIFIGGSVDFSTSKSEQDRILGTRKTSNNTFGLMPNVGKYLSENFAIGLGLDISSTRNKTDYTTESIFKSSNIGINPFIKYYALRWNNFSIYGQGNIGIDFAKTRMETDGITDNESKSTTVFINIYPGLSYDLNDKLSLQTSINILSFGYDYSVTKEGSTKEKGSNFNIGAGFSNILLIGGINIGAIYKF